MRTDGRQVAHLWANQSQSEARSNGSVSFAGDTLRSYREPIGQIVRSSTGARVALFRNRHFSVTTSKHQSWMRGAASHLESFTVEHIAPPQHGENLKDYGRRIENLAAKRRTPRIERETLHLIAEANRYAETFGKTTRFSADDLAGMAERLKTRQKRDAAAERRKEAKRIAKEQERLRDWLCSKSDAKPNLPTQYGRIVGDELETTTGARVPLAHIRRVSKIVRGKIEAGETWHRNGETIRIGQFQLDSIEADGSLRAGCHVFARDEVLRILDLV